MRKLVISDMALLGSSVDDTQEGIKLLKDLQNKGVDIIVLSNRPEYCMRKIGIKIGDDGSVSYEYIGPCDIKGNGIDVMMYNESVDKHIYRENIHPDYTIYGNGICIFDKYDQLLYQGHFINQDTLEAMISLFEENGYVSYDKLLLARDQFGDRCFGKGDNVYKFFAPENGVSRPSNNIYGMQCSGRDEEKDEQIIHTIEGKIDNIRGYRLNSKPCFYQRDVNKLTALDNLLTRKNIKIEDCMLILSELTDDVLIDSYSEQCEIVKGEYERSTSNTLAKVIKMM